MTAAEYRTVVILGKRCVDCGGSRGKRVRCDDCNAMHVAVERARTPRTGAYACSSCGERGHNVTTCQRAV